jgi:hypothetical protein
MVKREHPPNVPQIKEGIVPLWHGGYWDGPLNGICMYQGEPHFFEMKKEYHGKVLGRKIGRTYWIYKITPEYWEFDKYWHGQFCLHVGNHTNYVWSEEHKRYNRFVGTNPSSPNYWKEMYYDRYEAAHAEMLVKNPAVINIDRRNQVVGWAIWDVVMGMPWKEWRRPRKKEVQNVGAEKKDT